MESQNKLSEKEKDEFVEELNLTPEKIKEDMEKMKGVEGFPIGDDEDILELSNPPYYTAYPNPYIKKFVEKFGKPYDAETDDYHRGPFVGDVSEGKNEIEYSIHNYHTKVPPKAIENYINHYTKKNELVLDFFCGTGMAGVAATRNDRNCILVDLSPMATFIADNLTNNIRKSNDFISIINSLIVKIEKEYDWVYQTKSLHGISNSASYFLWSDVFTCIHCNFEFSFWDHGAEHLPGKVKTKKSFLCPNCNAELNIRKVKRVIDIEKDAKKRQCVKVFVKENGKNTLRDLNEFELNNLKKINDFKIPYWIPTNEINADWYTSRLSQSGPKKIKDVSRFFSKRNLLIISAFMDSISKIQDKTIRNLARFTITSLFNVISDRQGYFGGGGGMSGNFYMPIISMERNIFECLKRKLSKLQKVLSNQSNSRIIISCQSATDLSNIPDNSIDYIFVDPPFGANLMYSELNIIWEGWLKVLTNNKEEAIVNDFQKKEEDEYAELMEKSFKHAYRILKPNRWISIEFHNTKASIWRIIQNGLTRSGFIIAQVATLNKQQTTILQDIRAGAVNNDLMINAYKPSEEFRNVFLKKAGLNMESSFIQMHMDKLPIEPNVERTQQMLYSKLLAQYIQNGFEVRIDASEFYAMLKNNFIERDSFWFNSDQIQEYEKRTTLADKSKEYEKEARKSKIYRKAGFSSILGITDEKTAIVWLAQFLRNPKTYSEISIEFNKNLLTSEDQIPELKNILEENFVTEDGKYRLPSINEKKEREDVRNKRLIREFNDILQQAKAGKKIKEVRKEAILHGLMELYNKRDVDQIKILGSKLDRKILESDDEVYAIIDWAMAKGD